jgi:hypothetical protein
MVRNKLALCAVVFLLVTTPVGAQEGLRDRDRTFSASQKISADLRRARFRSGPFYLLSSIQLGDIGYDSQFFVPTTEQGSGISFGVSAPQRLYYVPNRKSVYSVEATPELTFFSRGKGSLRGNTQFGYLVRGDAQYLFNHLYLDFFALQSDSLISYTGEIDRLATRRQKSIGLAGEVKYSSKTSVSFHAATRGTAYPRDRYQPTDVDIFLLDRNDQTLRASLIHKTFPVTALHLSAERSNYTFDRDASRDSHRTYVGAGLDFDNGRNGLRFEAGPGKLDFKDRSRKSFSGPVGNASFTRRGALWTFTSGVNRDIDFSLTQTNSYYTLDRATLLIDYAATRKLRLRFTESYGVDRYANPAFNSLGLFLKRRDTMNWTAVGWLYTLRKLSGGFDVGYYKRTSNFFVDEQHGIRGILHLSFTP